jgi:hypothetical protein
MRCQECGSELDDRATFCVACGASVGGGDTNVSNGESFTSQYLGVLLLGASIIIVLVGTLYATLTGGPAMDPKTYHSATIEYAAGLSLDHANFFAWLLLGVITTTIVITIVTALRGRKLFIRRIPGLNAIDEAVGRATEMGRPILFSTGIDGLSITTLQALAVAAHVARTAVRYGTRLIMPVCDQTMVPITEEVVREAYRAEGRPEAFTADDIRFLSDRQFAYAAGVTGILHREQVAASFLFGQFYAESLILAENGQAVGAIQVAGTPDLLQTPFFVVTCDYTIIGDEFYAASAYLSREPTQLGSLVGQDIAKALLFVLIIVGLVIATVVQSGTHPLTQLLGGG